jgi:hypothetical protein
LREKNSVASVRKRTIPTERPPLVSEVSANFLRIEGATWSAWQIPTAVFSLSRQEVWGKPGTIQFTIFAFVISCLKKGKYLSVHSYKPQAFLQDKRYITLKRNNELCILFLILYNTSWYTRRYPGIYLSHSRLMLEHTHTHTHTHARTHARARTQTLTPVFIYPNLLSDKRTYTHSYIYIYIYNIICIHKILIHTYSHTSWWLPGVARVLNYPNPLSHQQHTSTNFYIYKTYIRFTHT